MAKNGFKIFDSDMHIMEPPDLWERYIDPEFRAQAPRGRTSENVRDLGTIFPTLPKDSRRTGGTPHRGRNYNKNQEIYRNHAERGWTGEVQLEAMDTEGIDVAVKNLETVLCHCALPRCQKRNAAQGVMSSQSVELTMQRFRHYSPYSGSSIWRSPWLCTRSRI